MEGFHFSSEIVSEREFKEAIKQSKFKKRNLQRIEVNLLSVVASFKSMCGFMTFTR